MEEVGHALNGEQLSQLARYFEEAVTFSKHMGCKVESVEPGRSVIYLDVKDIHLNGNGTLHGGVYSALMDNAMGLAVSALAGFRTATIALNVSFLGAVREGRITCRCEVVHRSRRLATAEAKVYDGGGELVALGTGTFRIFEKRGNPIV
ncbi:MAG: PaaI family thioesterase [Rubrobacteraceae bacterium]|uniref:PaaI family thioesterase n=1 Tax=Rubrobacter naiadicus TaxID=1392641 RepID=UPI002362FF3C|nr:PaaI family thioesterase [Rubrobacter naiadicus]MBX6763913.1 PaaI family thioesterase [Rubrobacteraceae bacterium]MCL6437029.1 PaaI family thioesterase [Rubrobacteraceae bacterium]